MRVGAGVWLCTLKSGIHPTIAGVVLGLLTPSKAGLTDAAFLERFERASFALRTEPVDEVSRRHLLSNLAFAAREATSPLVRLESNLHPWAAFLIMPLFALANAGVPINSSALDGAASLCGVGFTMAIFIASLLVEGPMLVAAKAGVLMGSAFSIVAGILILNRALRRQSPEPLREVRA